MPITAETITFGLTVFGAIAALWWRVEARIDSARQRAESAEINLAAYKTHVAETYVTKDGLREQFAAVMAGIAELKQQAFHISSRVDDLMEHRPTPRRRNGAQE